MIKVKQSGTVVYEHETRLLPPIDLKELGHQCGYRVAPLANELGISQRKLEKEFQKALAIGPKYWLKWHRMIRAQSMIDDGNPLKAVAVDLGFKNYDTFRREFKAFFNVPPTEFHSRNTRHPDIPALRWRQDP